MVYTTCTSFHALYKQPLPPSSSWSSPCLIAYRYRQAAKLHNSVPVHSCRRIAGWRWGRHCGVALWAAAGADFCPSFRSISSPLPLLVTLCLGSIPLSQTTLLGGIMTMRDRETEEFCRAYAWAVLRYAWMLKVLPPPRISLPCSGCAG